MRSRFSYRERRYLSPSISVQRSRNPAGDDLRSSAERVCIEVGVALRGAGVGVSQELADDRQPEPATRAIGREGVAEIMKPKSGR